MTTKEKTRFVSFDTAMMAAQVIAFHYAHIGYQVSCSFSRESKVVEVTIFHDSITSIVPPEGLNYSRLEESHSYDTYWCSLHFNY